MPGYTQYLTVATQDSSQFTVEIVSTSPRGIAQDAISHWRGIRLCQGYDVTRATTVAPGIERVN
jgi:hypothetical protein